jgi:hypothetical protein
LSPFLEGKIGVYEFQLFYTYESLTRISNSTKFYDVLQHKMLSDKELISKALQRHQADYRYRFLCEISLNPPIDYSQLDLKVFELANAINAILKKRSFFDVNFSTKEIVTIKELWVKKIGLKIFTPPQFEEAVKYSLSQKLIISHSILKDRLDKKSGVKNLFIDLSCDYQVFIGDKFSFSFDYIRDIQFAYLTLNDQLKSKYNFHHFVSAFSEEK